MGELSPVYNLKEWIDNNRDLLKPPVGNKMIFEDENYIVMAVGGPNARKDFHHHDRGGELFYMVEGDMELLVMEEEGKPPRTVRIDEGDIFLMGSDVIHSPQRPPESVGVVVELKAKSENVIDRLYWYCENCHHRLHAEEFRLSNIVTELPPIMEKFFGSKELRTCEECGTVMEKPKPKKPLN